MTRVLCDPVDENTIYATVSGFRWDEYIPHVLKSTDLGQSWTDISSNLPGIPVADIVVDPDHPGYLYVATDAGVFFSNNDGISWESLNEGIHGVPTMTLKIHNPTRTLVAGTHGLSAFRLNMDDLVTGTAIAENNQPQYKVYPNPFTDKIKVAGSLNNIEVALYTLDGKLIADADANGEIETINLPKGTYVLEIQQKGKIIQTDKLIKN